MPKCMYFTRLQAYKPTSRYGKNPWLSPTKKRGAQAPKSPNVGFTFVGTNPQRMGIPVARVRKKLQNGKIFVLLQFHTKDS